MDAVAQLQDTEILKVVETTIGAFVPLLEAKRKEIEEIPRKTFKFGNLDRNHLDVYYPIDPPASGKVPIIFFIYGGGFVQGARVHPPPLSLVYPSLGSFFARRGFLTVIPDYRLVPEVAYPASAEDVRDAVAWVVQHLDTIASTSVIPDADQLFIMSHSAGTAHVTTMILEPDVQVPPVVKIKGLILNGGPYHFPDSHSTGPITLYYGAGQLGKREPLALLEAASDTTIRAFPEVVLAEAEREPDWLKSAGVDFQNALERRLGRKVQKIIAKGHNHISPNLALGSGEGEEWGEEVIQWIKVRLMQAELI